MKPTIGRIVIYKTTDSDRESMKKQSEESGTCNVQETLPAIIVAVWSETTVNLQVIGDGERWTWHTSVQQGDDQGQWQWLKKEDEIIEPTEIDNENPRY